MTAQIIPCRTDLVNYNLGVTLDGVSLDLGFYFNERTFTWLMSIFDPLVGPNPDGSRPALVSDLPVVLGYPLLRQFQYVVGLPGGEFMAIDSSGQDQEAGLGDLGARVFLAYIPVADLATTTGR